MGYVDEHLGADETVVFRTTLHPVIFAWPVVLGGVGLLFLPAGQETATMGLFFLLIGGSAGLAAWLRRRFSEFAVTDRRVILKTGVLRRTTVETQLTGVESLSVNQGLLGRMLGFGKLLVRGTGGTNESFSKINSPMKFRRHVQEQSAASHEKAAEEHIHALRKQGGAGQDERNERECPYCAELILAKAQVCKHCGSEVEPAVS